MKVPAMLAGLYRKLHRCQQEEKDLYALLLGAKATNPVSIAKSIVANSHELNEVMAKIDAVQIALNQLENGILDDMPELS